MYAPTRRTRTTVLFLCLAVSGACETYRAEPASGSSDEASSAESGQAAKPATEAAAATPAAADPSPGAEPGCDEVVAHLVSLTEKEIAGLSEEERAQAAGVLPVVRKQVSEACSTSGWSAEFKRCILASSSEASLRACEKFAPEPSAPAAVQIPPNEAANPAAAKVDGPACSDVVDHVIEVAVNAPDIPPDQREQMKTMMPQQKQLMLQACDSMPWPAPLRNCLLAAKNATDMQGCRSFATP